MLLNNYLTNSHSSYPSFHESIQNEKKKIEVETKIHLYDKNHRKCQLIPFMKQVNSHTFYSLLLLLLFIISESIDTKYFIVHPFLYVIYCISKRYYRYDYGKQISMPLR